MGALKAMMRPTEREDTERTSQPAGPLQLAGCVPGSDPRWQAVLARDGRFDGVFVYAVRSTGIYCRPSCPSRRPRREQAIFFPAPDAAEQAGFRPCRRCQPRETGLRHPHAELVDRVCRAIDARMKAGSEERLNLEALSAEVGASSYHLQRTFKRIMGITPREYVDARRLGQLKARLKEGKDVTTALYDAGYGSSSRLYERASAQLGMTPGTYRGGGRDVRIRYTIADCPLGRLLVGATERGVSAVSLGDSDAPLEAALREEYPHAQLERESIRSNDRKAASGLARAVRAIVAHLEGSRPRLNLPLDLEATAFQRRVWQQLGAIPYGSTRSYSDVARAIGRPKAVRAVARACATNPACIVIPCHRVVRTDGGLGGYRWGIGRKRKLLEKESRKGSRRVER